MKKYTIRTAGRSAIGTLQMVAGILLLAMGVIRFLTAGIWRHFTGEVPVLMWAAPALIFVACAWLFYLGIMNFTTIRRGKRLVSLLSAQKDTVSLTQVSDQMARSKAGLLRDLSRMKKQKYFRDICVLEDCIVLEGAGWDRALMIGADKLSFFSERRRPVFGDRAIYETRKKAEPDPMRELTGTGERIAKEIRQKAGSIANAQISVHVNEIVVATEQMLEFVKERPEKYFTVRQSVEYYLPTISGLLSEYRELGRQAVKGNNIMTAMEKIEESMGMAAESIRMELDGLYLDKMIDITVDVEVMENIMKEKRSLLWNQNLSAR